MLSLLSLLACSSAPEPVPAPEPQVPASSPPSALPAPATGGDWSSLGPGLDLGEFLLPTASFLGDSRLRVVRIDPAVASIELRMDSETDGPERDGLQWLADVNGPAALINAAMFQADFSTGTGFMRSAKSQNNPSWASEQNSLFAAGPRSPGLPAFHLFNLGCEPKEAALNGYSTLVQSIRMLGCQRDNIWAEQPKSWSAALVGEDGEGRALFLHVRSPYTMHALVDLLQALPLDLRALHYGEGGPEATLCWKAAGAPTCVVGSYETGFVEHDAHTTPDPLPNVLVARSP